MDNATITYHGERGFAVEPMHPALAHRLHTIPVEDRCVTCGGTCEVGYMLNASGGHDAALCPDCYGTGRKDATAPDYAPYRMTHTTVLDDDRDYSDPLNGIGNALGRWIASGLVRDPRDMTPDERRRQ